VRSSANVVVHPTQDSRDLVDEFLTQDTSNSSLKIFRPLAKRSSASETSQQRATTLILCCIVLSTFH
jgi:hypothetical protein